MNSYLIMFSSVTIAMKSRNILMRYNIMSKVIRTPMHISKRSCGYSLVVSSEPQKIIDILRSNGISVLGSTAVDNL